jgi:hypothetical protein
MPRPLWMRYAHGVAVISPTIEGFRAAFRRPAVSCAEVLWRWSVGATAVLLLFFGTLEYLSSLPVTGGEILFLRTKQPILVAKAIAHIFGGNWGRGLAAALLAALALMLLWMLAASLGRMGTVGSLLDYFRRDTSLASFGAESQPSATVFRSLFRLSFLRIMVAIAAIAGLVGGAVLAGFATPDSNPHPGLAFLIFLFVAAFVCLAWWILNWILSLAAVLEVRDAGDALGAISAAVALCRERASAVFAVSFWTGLVHLAAFVVATSIAFLPLALVGTISWRFIVPAMAVITLAYFAVADWIYIARLAGYVCITELPDAVPEALPQWPTHRPVASARAVAATDAAVDRDELILSDLPNLTPDN